MNKYTKILVLAMLLIAVVQGFAQIGGSCAFAVFYYTYSIEWTTERIKPCGIYPPGTTQADLEAGSSSAYRRSCLSLVPPTPLGKVGKGIFQGAV